MNHPTSWDLITLWLSKHFEGQPAVVLSNVIGASNVKRILAYFPKDERTAAIAGQHSILPCKTVEDAVHICNKIPDSDPFAFVWDGKKVVHENT